MDIDEEFDSLGLPRAKKSLAWQARARITWGDSRDDVRTWLIDSGIDPLTAEQILSIAGRERATAVRLQGVRDLLVGIPIGVVGAGAGIGLVAIVKLGQLQAEIKGMAVMFALSLIVLAYGVHLIVRGVGRLLVGGQMRGAVSDLED